MEQTNKSYVPNIHFYDIECLKNVFCLANYKKRKKDIDLYYLLGQAGNLSNIANGHLEQMAEERIKERNHNFHGKVRLYNLKEKENSIQFMSTFGLSDSYMANDPLNNDSYRIFYNNFRLTCDTDPDYNEDLHPYLMGYNSNQYDTTMLALYGYLAFPVTPGEGGRNNVWFKPPEPERLRFLNDQLFSPMFKSNMPSFLARSWDGKARQYQRENYSDPRWRIRKNMLFSGRHIDVAKLNEKQVFVGLKRIIGLNGGQILESDKLASGQDTIYTLDELLELFAYNVSDVVNLDEYVFEKEPYKDTFNLKRSIMREYPEMVYTKQEGSYAPNISSKTVRRDRITIDSTSAQIVTKALCPYGELTDAPAVSFLYPSEEKAKELNIPRRNILDEAKGFFYDLFHQPDIRAKFDEIYKFYKSIEGQNFNKSTNYAKTYQNTPAYKAPMAQSDVPPANTFMVYYAKDGSPTSCYVNFSIGGIHGAEYNKALYDADVKEYEKQAAILEKVKAMYPNPEDLKAAKRITIDGVEYKASAFLKNKTKTNPVLSYKPVTKPELFIEYTKDGVTRYKLNDKYGFTSADPTSHQDFTSYYPILLVMMMAFFNKMLGYDRYYEIYEKKEIFGKLMKDVSLSKAERESYKTNRGGVKLMINAASGAGDANYESPILINNKIISMRIIGQLFTWMIGQAQAAKGGKTISTNTDGLYTNIEEHLGNKILKERSKNIGVEIEPEPIYLISKDTNNRIEVNMETGEVEGANGGSVACYKGPNATKSLDHPAIIDWALTEYLITAAMSNGEVISLSKPFHETVGRNILRHAKKKFSKTKYLHMFQNIVASSVGSMNYIYATDPLDQTENEAGEKCPAPIILQHYNRVFILKDNTPGTVHLQSACGKKITPAQKKKRAAENLRSQIHDETAMQVLSRNGVSIDDMPSDRECVVTKVKKIEPEWYMHIENRALNDLSEDEADALIDALDEDKYLQLLKEAYEDNWMNTLPEPKEKDESEEKPVQKMVPAQAEMTGGSETETSQIRNLFLQAAAEPEAGIRVQLLRPFGPPGATVTSVEEEADCSREEIEALADYLSKTP